MDNNSIRQYKEFYGASNVPLRSRGGNEMCEVNQTYLFVQPGSIWVGTVLARSYDRYIVFVNKLLRDLNNDGLPLRDDGRRTSIAKLLRKRTEDNFPTNGPHQTYIRNGNLYTHRFHNEYYNAYLIPNYIQNRREGHVAVTEAASRDIGEWLVHQEIERQLFEETRARHAMESRLFEERRDRDRQSAIVTMPPAIKTITVPEQILFNDILTLDNLTQEQCNSSDGFGFVLQTPEGGYVAECMTIEHIRSINSRRDAINEKYLLLEINGGAYNIKKPTWFNSPDTIPQGDRLFFLEPARVIRGTQTYILVRLNINVGSERPSEQPRKRSRTTGGKKKRRTKRRSH